MRNIFKKNSKEEYIVILEIPNAGNKEDITGAKVVYVDNHRNVVNLDEILEFFQRKDTLSQFQYKILFLAHQEEKRHFKAVNWDEEEVIDIYRHLNRSNKTLIRRTIKNLDTYYQNQFYESSGQDCDYVWFDNPAKIIHYTLEESDLLNSFRALNYWQKSELLNAMHTQITHYKDSKTKYSQDEQQIIEDFRQLNLYEKDLIKNNIKKMLNTKIESERKKKSE